MGAGIFLDTWTIRGLIDVLDDIHLLPGNVFSIESDGAGTYFISTKGTTDQLWNDCDDLQYVPGPAATIAGLPVLTSQNFPTYTAMLKAFIDHPPECEHMEGTLVLNEMSTRVIIYVIPPVTPRTKYVILLNAAHNHQNGTAHGDD